MSATALHPPSHLTGAPVMQLEIRNAVERDQIVYNGLGLLFGAVRQLAEQVDALGKRIRDVEGGSA